MAEAWIPRLSPAAEADFDDIVRWTAGRFGTWQSERYREQLYRTIDALRSGPDVPGSRSRPDSDIRILHTARFGRRGRHAVYFRVIGSREIEVVRILHDAMDTARHLPGEPGPKRGSSRRSRSGPSRSGS